MTIAENFRFFHEKHGKQTFQMLSEFFTVEKENFYKDKIRELQAEGLTEAVAMQKARQGWVSTIGHALEEVVKILVQDFCVENDIKIAKDNELIRRVLTEELDKVKRAVAVGFNDFLIVPDGDIILYRLHGDEVKILAILSVKNSFRERYTETPYWKLKLLQSKVTQHIKVFMVTPDNDDEISFVDQNSRPRKARIVMEYELDGLYLAKPEFDGSDKVKSIDQLIPDLTKLL